MKAAAAHAATCLSAPPYRQGAHRRQAHSQQQQCSSSAISAATQRQLNKHRPRRHRAAAALRRPPAAVAAAADQQPQQQRTPLLNWLVDRHGATPACLKVERRYAGEALGYCLIATADIEPGETLLAVPLTIAISSEGVDESRWSTHMAAELLERQAAAAAASAAAAAAGGDGDAGVAAAVALSRTSQAWLDALPAHVDLPWLYWTEAELAELQDDDTLAEADHLRSIFEAACEVRCALLAAGPARCWPCWLPIPGAPALSGELLRCWPTDPLCPSPIACTLCRSWRGDSRGKRWPGRCPKSTVEALCSRGTMCGCLESICATTP